jgi:diaminopimelate decarboxylase
VTAFAYRDGVLHAEGVSLARLADEVGTPFYVYAAGAIEASYDAYARGLADAGLRAIVAYGVKANDNLAVIATLARRGAGADVVSGGEIARSIAAGVAPGRIIYSGVGKTPAEIAQALDVGIRQFNVESAAEIDTIARIAGDRGVAVPVALRINPDVDAGTHHKISTGRKGDKFGIDMADAPALYARMAADRRLAPRGLALHIGSQVLSLAPFRAAFGAMAGLARTLRAEGLPVASLDFGGGLGVAYRDDAEAPSRAAYGRVIAEAIGDLPVEVAIEPGRSMVALAGVLVTRVVATKESHGTRFVVVDAAMNDLLRPAMYDAFHGIRPVAQPVSDDRGLVDVVGPICESSDVFARARPMPPVAAGHVLVIDAAGAYGRVMASCYNARPLIPEVMVRGDRADIIRRRPTFEETIALEAMPAWLAPAATQGAA